MAREEAGGEEASKRTGPPHPLLCRACGRALDVDSRLTKKHFTSLPKQAAPRTLARAGATESGAVDSKRALRRLSKV